MLCFRIDSGRNFLALLHFFLLFSSSRLVFINVWKLTKFLSPSFLFQAMKTFNTLWPPYTVSLQPFVSPSRPSYAFSPPPDLLCFAFSLVNEFRAAHSTKPDFHVFPRIRLLAQWSLCYFLIGNFQYFSFGISTSIRNLLYWKLISILNVPFVSIFIIFCRNPSLEVCKDRCVGIDRSYWRDLAPFRYAFLTKLCLVLVR